MALGQSYLHCAQYPSFMIFCLKKKSVIWYTYLLTLISCSYHMVTWAFVWQGNVTTKKFNTVGPCLSTGKWVINVLKLLTYKDIFLSHSRNTSLLTKYFTSLNVCKSSELFLFESLVFGCFFVQNSQLQRIVLSSGLKKPENQLMKKRWNDALCLLNIFWPWFFVRWWLRSVWELKEGWKLS